MFVGSASITDNVIDDTEKFNWNIARLFKLLSSTRFSTLL